MPATVTVPVGGAGLADGATLVDRLGAVPGTIAVAGGSITLALPARSAAIGRPGQ